MSISCEDKGVCLAFLSKESNLSRISTIILEKIETRFFTTTLDTSLPKPLGSLLSQLPTYTGFGIDAYTDWEIALDNYFEGCRICDKRKIKIAASYLASHALTWWENLYALDMPKTWSDMKILMTKQFDPHQLEEQISFVSSFVPNILQDNVQHKEEDKKDEDLAMTHDHDVLEITTALVTPLSKKKQR